MAEHEEDLAEERAKAEILRREIGFSGREIHEACRGRREIADGEA